MKRLFVLRRGKGGSIVKDDDGQPLYFPTKVDAKRMRDSIGKDVVVSFGIDHRKFKGV